MKVRIVLTGRSYHVAEEVPSELSLPDKATVSEALEALKGLVSQDDWLPDSCVVAVSGKHVGTVADHEQHREAVRA